MKPTPLTAAFPKLAAQIDDERPLISAALLDIRITAIEDHRITADVLTDHSHALLTSPSQHDWLDAILSRFFTRPMGFVFSYNPIVQPSALELALSPPLTEGPPRRTANTLTFTERAALQNWMQQPGVAVFVANESDPAASRQATNDLQQMVRAAPGDVNACEAAFPGLIITPGNIASMRKILGIEKTKTAAVAKAKDIDLVALHARVQQHHLQLDPIAGLSLAEVLTNLRDSLHALEKRLTALEATDD